MDDTSEELVGLPSTSRAVVVALTALLAAVLLSRTGLAPLVPAVAGAGGLLAGSLWLVGWTRWTAVGQLCASLLVAPTAVALLAVSGGALAVGVGEGRPGPATAATAIVALGCLLAVFGAVTAPWGLYDRTRIATLLGVAVRTGIPLSVVAGILFASGVVGLSSGGDGAATPVGTVLAPVLDPLFAPTPGRTHIGVFCLLLGTTTLAVQRTVLSLPLRELLAETTDDTATVESATRALALAALLSVGLGLAGLVVELGPGQVAIAGTLGPAGYDAVVGLTGGAGLRELLWTTLVASLVVRAAVWLLRRAARSSADRVATVLAPYVSGSLLAVGLLVVAEPAVGTLVATAQSTAPGPVAGGVTRLLTALSGNYGAGLVLLVGGVALLSLASCAVGSLWLVLAIHYLDDRNPGVNVAAAGLFSASVFAATLGAATWLVLAGLVGAVVVWDTGTFGRTLRREVGTVADTRRTELTHAGGTVAVGGVGAAVALAVLDVSGGAVAAAPGTGYATLLVALFAAIVLVVALR